MKTETTSPPEPTSPAGTSRANGSEEPFPTPGELIRMTEAERLPWLLRMPMTTRWRFINFLKERHEAAQRRKREDQIRLKLPVTRIIPWSPPSLFPRKRRTPRTTPTPPAPSDHPGRTLRSLPPRLRRLYDRLIAARPDRKSVV